MIKSLSSLRFVFILFIFLHHCRGYVGGGSMGVAFFFVLGGFCMALGYKEKVLRDDFKYSQYLTRRLIKFYPLHWLCLFAVIILAAITSIPVTGGGRFSSFLLNFSLLHSWVPIKEVYFSYNSVSWYLANTIFFAVVFPVIFKWILRTTNCGRICFASVLAITYIATVLLIPSEEWHAILYVSPYIRLTDFVFGIYLALAYNKIKETQWSQKTFGNGTINMLLTIIAIALLVVESVILGNYQLVAPLYWPLIAIVIITTTLSNQSGGMFTVLENRWLVRFGDSSFTFFMIHTIVLKFAKIKIPGSVLYCFVLIVLLTFLIDRFILPPITRWLTKKLQPSMTARS